MKLFEVKRSVQVGEALQSLNWGKLPLVHFNKYNQTKYEIAIKGMDIVVKPPLITWSVS